MQPSEAEIIPYQASPVPEACSVIVFAPHPDDEVFGCGGAIAQHVQAGHSVHVILLTSGGFDSLDGAGEGYAQTRLNESAQAARLLGLPPPRCWGLVDRAVAYDETLVQRMVQAIAETGADVVYAPSPWELHPDHRAAAMGALEAVRRSEGEKSLYLYEVSAPLRPNVLIDVTAVWGLKQQAMQLFRSQEEKLPYASFISALNRFRALTLSPAVEYAEAFERRQSADLRRGGALMIEGERDRLLALGVTVIPQDAPLVSVIVRTMGRSTLVKALNSVALQTYSHLEIVLVDAAGQGLPGLDTGSGRVPGRVVSSGNRLGRAQAANAGMEAASGEYLIFLDDDDWFYPDHIAKLVRVSRIHPTALAIHTGVECVDHDGRVTGEVFDFPYATGELCFGNFLPIHAVLFHRSLMQQGCKFDDDFDLYEDWDFWLQVERQTAFVYVAGVSAAYRIHVGAGEGVQVDPQRSIDATKRIYDKWNVLHSEQHFLQLIGRSVDRRRLRRELDRNAQQHRALSAESVRVQAQAHQDRIAAGLARRDAHELRQAHDKACEDRDAANRQAMEAWKSLAGAQERWAIAHEESVNAKVQAAILSQELSRLSTELPLARDHATNLEHALCLTEQALAESRQDTQKLLQSTSWRITWPVRRVGALVRKARVLLRAVEVARGRGFAASYLFKRSLDVYRREGFSGLRERIRRQLTPSSAAAEATQRQLPGTPDTSRSYASWVEQFDTATAADAELFAKQLASLESLPLISVVMPVYKPQPDDLRKAINSVRAQIYPNWELCICDDASPGVVTRTQLRDAAKEDPRIRIVFHEKNQHISHATNSALALASGEYVALLDHDDELRPHSLLRVVQAFEANPAWRLIYSDEDKIDQAGNRFDPYFKPDFNLGLLRSHNYMCHFAVYQRTLFQELGGARAGFEGAQDYDLVLRAVDALSPTAIGHIPEVLYHWRTAVGSTAAGHANKSYAFEAGQRALAEHLERRGLSGEIVEAPEAGGMYRVRWTRPNPAPLVSIVIPTRNGLSILRQCLDSLRQTSYPNYEVILVDNGSDDLVALAFFSEREKAGQIRVIRDDGPFNFSAINNRAVREMARGEFVLLMNNDIEIIHPEWLDEMVGAALEPGVGCVGARLWYPDGRLQHAGVILVCGVAGHAHKLLGRGVHGYMGRAVIAQDFVAVTAACLLVRRSIFDEVNGLDESLAVAFNDVDFCLRVHQAGYRNHWTPYAELLHHESVSRGYEDTPEKQRRFQGEIKILQDRWDQLLRNDPCYNPNLTIDAEDFSLAWPPRSSLHTNSTRLA